MRRTLTIACVLFSALAAAVPSTISAANADDPRRVEFPRARFAVTFPEGWRQEETNTDAPVLHQADSLWASETCLVLWYPAPATAEDAARRLVDRAKTESQPVPASTALVLPAGNAVRMDHQEDGFAVIDYLVDVEHGGVAILNCYARTPPDDHWLPIARTIDAMRPEIASAADVPPVSRYEFDGRVELPASGFAIYFPAEWEVLGSSTSPFGVDEVRVVLEAWADGVSCRVLDSSALWGSSGDHTLESMHEPVVERFSSGPWRILDASYLELLSGRSGRVVYEDVDGPVVETHADYSLTDGQTWLTLQCSSPTPPDDNWLSLAETVEFLAPEEKSTTAD